MDDVDPQGQPHTLGEGSSPAPAPAAGQSSWPVRMFRYASLRFKLIVPYVTLTLAVAVIGVYILTRLVTSSQRERFVNQIYEASRAAADGMIRQERDHLENLRLFVFLEGVAPAVAASDASTLESVLAPIALNNGVEILTAIDRNGREIVTLVQGASVSQGQDYSDLPLVQRVLRGEVDAGGDKFAGLVETPSGYYLMTSAPVTGAGGQLAGVMLLGTSLDSLMAELKLQTLADVVVLDTAGRLLATTFPPSDEGYGALELAQGLEALPLSEPLRIQLYQRDFDIYYAPLRIREQVVGVLGVSFSSSYIVEAEAQSRGLFSVLFALGTGAIIMLGYLLAQIIARPILRLRSISQAVAAGDLTQRSGVGQGDEIGDLAQAFDTMTLRLRERTEEAAQLYAESVKRNQELMEINLKLQATQAQLIQSEKLAAIGQLTAGIVHDVKNPLAVIKGTAEVLYDDFNLDTEVRHYLANIRDSAGRASRIVSDLLKFARESTPEMQQRDLKETLETVTRLTAYLAREARVRVEMDTPPEPVLAVYDPQQIEQVLINLIQNALQAMPQGGSLRIRLRQANESVAVEVQDTGTGIAPEHLTRIFDPFFTTKPEGEGTGLGLSVSYGIVARHGGQITVDSTLGQGTTFTIMLPANDHRAGQG